MATLSYAYAESAVLLEELAVESHPMTHDLCRVHADGVKVPRGWNLFDVRNQPSEGGTNTIRDGCGANGAALRLVGA